MSPIERQGGPPPVGIKRGVGRSNYDTTDLYSLVQPMRGNKILLRARAAEENDRQESG